MKRKNDRLRDNWNFQEESLAFPKMFTFLEAMHWNSKATMFLFHEKKKVQTCARKRGLFYWPEEFKRVGTLQLVDE